MMVATLEILLKDGLSEFSCTSVVIGKFGHRQTQINGKPNIIQPWIPDTSQLCDLSKIHTIDGHQHNIIKPM
jgi:hypothetical protein